MTSKDPNNHSPQAHVSSSSSSKGKAKDPLSTPGPGANARTDTTAATAPGGFIGAIAASARNAASALDPRQASVITQHHSLNTTTGGSSSSSGFLAGPNSKAGAAASTASRSFQHATTALEKTLEGSSSNSDATAFAQPSSSSHGFRHAAGSGSATGAMDWDNFLASSDSTVQDDRPYQPPSMSSFNFSTLAAPEPAMRQQHQQQEQQAREFDSAFQAHLSQPMNLTPANHAAFLEYLKSTAHPTPQTPTAVPSTSSSSSHFASSSSVQHQWYTPTHSTDPDGSRRMMMISDDIQRQRHMDGSEVLAFLESTSYSDFVDELDSAGGMMERHQHERRQFVYSEPAASSLRNGSSSSSTLFSTLQLIQNLPSERQDIVQYLLNQGTYSEDVWARPFGHDEGSHEAASLAATLAEQDEFLRRQHDKAEQGGGQQQQEDEDATTEEMERVLKQIVDDAKQEVKTGQTDGRAVNRLLMVRSHITMGTKL
ncbi:hypothetical protein BGZ72_010061 [Mortierella alpina]|nr:hypothetical protein BGZ72_010061 [Mortierella alpina]